eukprot:gene35621-43923_t
MPRHLRTEAGIGYRFPPKSAKSVQLYKSVTQFCHVAPGAKADVDVEGTHGKHRIPARTAVWTWTPDSRAITTANGTETAAVQRSRSQHSTH